MQTSHARHAARIFGLTLAALAIAVPTASAHKRHGHKHHGHHGHGHHHAKKDVKLQLLGINDFHGQLEALDPALTSSGRVGTIPAGGAEYFAKHVQNLEKGVKNSLVVSAGDLIGASPLTSALFHDEPTIEAMNKIGLDINAVGNHEFDEGEQELLRMQYGGCHPNPPAPTQTCANGRFRGADFQFLAANVVRKSSGRPMFAPYTIKKVDGVKVGFIGMTLEGTPQIVAPSGITNLNFLDEADTANKYARELRRKHDVEAIVVVLHEGGQQNPTSAPVNDCLNFSGPIIDIVNRTTDDVDLFLTGHTHQPYNCVIDGRPVTSAFSLGRVITDVDMKLSRRTGDVREVAINNNIVTRDVDKSGAMTRLITRYQQLAAPIANEPIGQAAASITRDFDDSRENALGNLIADAQLADTTAADRGDADLALMNPGGVRADLAAGEVTYGEAFSVQPFNNIVATQTFTGAQLLEVLKDQWCGVGQSSPTVLLPSASLTYTYSAAGAAAIQGVACSGAANPVSNVAINGTPLDPAASYRVTTNNFLADGGDGFTSLTAGTNRTTLSDFDIDSLVRYIEANSPVAPPALDRIDLAS